MISPSTWEQIRALFHAALERAPDERAAFLRAQSGDDEILREVASLLAAHADADAWVDEAGRHEAAASPEQAGAGRNGSPTASLPSGAQLGPYVVVSPLGAGAMGEVYRARDTNLRREVAIKVLPESLAANRDRLARFTREARTLGALNHPHIAQVHGFEEYGDVQGPGHGTGGGPGPRAARRARADSRGEGVTDRAADRRGARGGARARHRAPGSQARQHHDP